MSPAELFASCAYQLLIAPGFSELWSPIHLAWSTVLTPVLPAFELRECKTKLMHDNDLRVYYEKPLECMFTVKKCTSRIMSIATRGVILSVASQL